MSKEKEPENAVRGLSSDNTEAEDAIGPRTPREQKTRAAESAANTFVPAGMLPEFNKEPGYEYRWIRVATHGQPDNMNVNSRFREGWEPVKADDHPEIVQFNPDKRYEGMIENGGLLLCKISKEKIAARKNYYRNKAKSQLDAVDNDFLRLNDTRMPIFRERSTRVTRG